MSSPFRLDGQIAWVTGSSRGLGKVIAESLASEGARTVVSCYSGRERGEAIVADIRKRGGDAMPSPILRHARPPS